MREIPSDITVIGWSVVAVGWLLLSIVMFRIEPRGHPHADLSTKLVGAAFALGSLAAAAYVVLIVSTRR